MSSRRPGMYADISDDQLRNLFSSDNWKNNLSYEQRMAACQEVENRLAEERGTEPRNVMSEHMDGTCYGYQSGYTIALNEEMMRDGTFSSTYIDEQGSPQTITVDVPAPSWNTLDTICHEDMHGVQEDEGRAATMASYVKPETDYELYRIQPCEREAYDAGESYTLSAINRVEAASGEVDPDKLAYLEVIEQNSYDDARASAAEHYADPDIEQSLDEVLSDRQGGVFQTYDSESEQRISDAMDAQLAHDLVQDNYDGGASYDDGMGH